MPVQALIADIGATNARFAIATRDGVRDEHVLACADYPGLVDAARDYFLQSGIDSTTIRSAAFDIAGPVMDDWVEMTNHAWSFSIEETRKALGFDYLHVMNDFEAVALAIPLLDKKDIIKIGPGDARAGKNIGVIGPGTGLGVAGLFWDGKQHVASPCEGGHVTLPTSTQREFDVVQNMLNEKYSHVSAERVCSGKGIVNIYDALRRIDGRSDLPDRDAQDISTAAMKGTCALCIETMELFIGFLGVVAGNLALTLDALGGIYIAGGIPVKLGDYFLSSNFRSRFNAKGRYEDYMKEIPVYLITHPFIAFVGLRNDLIRTGKI